MNIINNSQSHYLFSSLNDDYNILTYIPLNDTNPLVEERSFEYMLKFSSRAIVTRLKRS